MGGGEGDSHCGVRLQESRLDTKCDLMRELRLAHRGVVVALEQRELTEQAKDATHRRLVPVRACALEEFLVETSRCGPLTVAVQQPGVVQTRKAKNRRRGTVALQ